MHQDKRKISKKNRSSKWKIDDSTNSIEKESIKTCKWYVVAAFYRNDQYDLSILSNDLSDSQKLDFF